MIGQQLEELTRRRSKQWKTYEEALDDTPQEEVIAHGIAILPDSKGKFERIMDLLEIAIEQVKQGKYDDADTVLTMIYGKESDSMHTARVRGWIEDLTETPDSTPDQERLLNGLNEERLKWNGAWLEHLETMQPPSQAEQNACFVPKGKAWRALTRQAASLDQRLDKKMRLYWETQKKDRERMVRRFEEEKLEATPEEEAAEQEAKGFIAKLGALIQEVDAKLKEAGEGRGAVSAGQREPEAVGKRGDNTARSNTTASTDGQKPTGGRQESPSGSKAETPPKG